jgi:tRNA dimethylallyltransferase
MMADAEVAPPPDGSLPDARAFPPLVVLTGPTGVGKTRIAVDLAERLGGEIVGADSVQVYRGFDAGSSKPSLEELRGIRHHLIDILEPDAPIDAAGFAARADAAIQDAHARGAVPIVVGGTGLWLRALLRGLVEVPAVDPALRAALERQWDLEGADAMHRRLVAVDPRTAARVHAHDRLRVVRALEVHAQTGTALGELRARHRLGAHRYRALGVFVDIEPAHWRERVAARTRAMLARGWIDEVHALLDRYGQTPRALRSVGYRQVTDHVVRGAPRDTLEAAITRATFGYGRRQRTWGKADPDVSVRVAPEACLRSPLLDRIEEHARRAQVVS